MNHGPELNRRPSRQVVTIPAEVSNHEFLARYARPGCVGLACGTGWIDRAIAARQNPADLKKIKGEVKTFCLKHPMYQERLRA